jgi:hypothetical protein
VPQVSGLQVQQLAHIHIFADLCLSLSPLGSYLHHISVGSYQGFDGVGVLQVYSSSILHYTVLHSSLY